VSVAYELSRDPVGTAAGGDGEPGGAGWGAGAPARVLEGAVIDDAGEERA
jgi:hypothetical protein